MNKGGVEEWLAQCSRKYPKTLFSRKTTKDQVLELAAQVPHHCLTCWWLQFHEDHPNRGCVYDSFNLEKLPFKRVPEAQTWLCLGWRVDPEARSRVQGFQGFIM